MAQTKKYEGEVEVHCEADKVFDIWTRNAPQVSKMCPDKFPKIELVQGDYCHTPGAIVSWTYAAPVDGKHESAKTVLEEIDEKKRSFNYKVIEGNIMNKYYNTWKETVEIVPKGANCSIVKYSVECEKKSEDAPDPNMYVEFLIGCVEEMYSRLYSSA